MDGISGQIEGAGRAVGASARATWVSGLDAHQRNRERRVLVAADTL